VNYETFQQLGLALLLGLLVGLQRERAQPTVAGIRTFALVTVFGTVCAWLGSRYGEWIVAAGLLGIAALFVTGYFARLRAGDADAGLTTEVAGILMYGIGAYLVVGSLAAAVVCGGAVAVLLQWKQPLHRFVAGMGEQDVTAIMQFVLITLVILPVLPNRTYGPFAVLNPFKLWLMVVLIVGIGLTGYVLYKWLGARAGALLSGLLGGLISSTATTVSFARRAKENPATAGAAVLVVVLAAATVFGRVLVEIATVAPGNFARLAWPLVTMLGVAGLVAAWSYLQARQQPGQLGEQQNPAELKSALVFGVLYAVILLAVAAAKQYLGAGGLYVVAIVSGLTDMDAITLSTAQLVEDGRLVADIGWRLILVASLANLVFKAGLMVALAGWPLGRRVAGRFGLALLGGILILWLWPGS
jgi:uncharacterized membrane protein (DUF4010 family)